MLTEKMSRRIRKICYGYTDSDNRQMQSKRFRTYGRCDEYM